MHALFWVWVNVGTLPSVLVWVWVWHFRLRHTHGTQPLFVSACVCEEVCVLYREVPLYVCTYRGSNAWPTSTPSPSGEVWRSAKPGNYRSPTTLRGHSSREDVNKNAVTWHFLSPHALQQLLPLMVVCELINIRFQLYHSCVTSGNIQYTLIYSIHTSIYIV